MEQASRSSVKEQLAMPTSSLVQGECHVLSAEAEQDEEVIAPLSVDGGGWDEAVAPLELEIRYWTQREEPEEGWKQVSKFAFAFVAMGDSNLTVFLRQTMDTRSLFPVRRRFGRRKRHVAFPRVRLGGKSGPIGDTELSIAGAVLLFESVLGVEMNFSFRFGDD